jgi:hypothetical protein
MYKRAAAKADHICRSVTRKMLRDLKETLRDKAKNNKGKGPEWDNRIYLGGINSTLLTIELNERGIKGIEPSDEDLQRDYALAATFN